MRQACKHSTARNLEIEDVSLEEMEKRGPEAMQQMAAVAKEDATTGSARFLRRDFFLN
jgi:hypothetical protein